MAESTTADLVETVLEAMQRAARGDAGAADELTDEPETPTEVVAPDALTCESKVFARPNGTAYHVRKIGIHDDVALLQRSREKNLPILTTGLPGTGKTALIEAAFGDGGFYTVQGHGDTEVADFIGSYVPVSATEFDWQDGPLIRAMEEGRPLYVDEIALIDPKVMAMPYGVMDGRNEIAVTQNPARGTVKCQPGFYVIAACNPNAPGARMSEALLSRFPIQFETKTDYGLALKLGVPKKVVNAAQNMNKKVENNEGLGWAPQLRELLDFSRVAAEFGSDMALSNLIAIAPEIDRDVVQDVLQKAMGVEVMPLALD
jgi:MoxR-like ATPase